MPLSPRRPLAGILLASALALSASGCFAASPDAASESTSGSGAGRISLVMLQPPRSGLTPLSDDAFKLSRWSAAETLVTLDNLGDAQPSLATAWEQVAPTTWRVTLRQGVMFHDGTALTPEQVVGSLTAAASASPKPRILDGVSLAARGAGRTRRRHHHHGCRGFDWNPQERLSSPQLAILAASAYSAGGVVFR